MRCSHFSLGLGHKNCKQESNLPVSPLALNRIFYLRCFALIDPPCLSRIKPGIQIGLFQMSCSCSISLKIPLCCLKHMLIQLHQYVHIASPSTSPWPNWFICLHVWFCGLGTWTLSSYFWQLINWKQKPTGLAVVWKVAQCPCFIGFACLVFQSLYSVLSMLYKQVRNQIKLSVCKGQITAQWPLHCDALRLQLQSTAWKQSAAN